MQAKTEEVDAQLQSKAQETQQTIETQKGRLDQAIALHQEQFAKTQEERAESFQESLKAYRLVDEDCKWRNGQRPEKVNLYGQNEAQNNQRRRIASRNSASDLMRNVKLLLAHSSR